jgi:GT2 family glycosyltransferase
VKKLARVVQLDIPFNYSTLNNYGVTQSHGEIIALVNNDIEVINREWLSEMVSLAISPATGAVGAKLYYSDTKLQHGGVILGIGGVAGHSHKYFQKHTPGYFGRLIHRQNLSAVTAACLVVRKEVYCEVGGLDEQNLAVAFNDVDFCLRLSDAGYRNIWTPHAELYHHESVSRGAEDTIEKQTRFSNEVSYMQKRWGERLVFDPAYNPNLTLEHENFALAFPPRRKSQIQDQSTSKQVSSVTELKSVAGPDTKNKIQETA